MVMEQQTIEWQEVKTYQDITYHKAEGIARIAFSSS